MDRESRRSKAKSGENRMNRVSQTTGAEGRPDFSAGRAGYPKIPGQYHVTSEDPCGLGDLRCYLGHAPSTPHVVHAGPPSDSSNNIASSSQFLFTSIQT